MNKWILGVVVVALPTMAMAASKADAAQSKAAELKFNQLFQGVDENSDGKIAKDEAARNAPAMAVNFEAVDTNHDGGLTKKEIKEFSAQISKKRREFTQALERADKDKNGMLSRDESKVFSTLSNNFEQVDANHDQQLVIKEIADFLRARAENLASPSTASAPVTTQPIVPVGAQ